MSLLYPGRWRRKDKVIVQCDSRESPYCKGTHAVVFWRYKRNILNHGGRYVCNMCSLVERQGVINPRYLREDELKNNKYIFY